MLTETGIILLDLSVQVNLIAEEQYNPFFVCLFVCFCLFLFFVFCLQSDIVLDVIFNSFTPICFPL